MASLHCHRRLLFFLGRFSSFPHFPWVWLLFRIADYIQITLLSDHIVAIYLLRSLLLEFSSPVATIPLMVNDIVSAPHLYPLFFLLAPPHLYPLLFPLAAHPLKSGQDQWYSGATLISPEGWNSCGILRCWDHWLHNKYVAMLSCKLNSNVNSYPNDARSRSSLSLMVLSVRRCRVIDPGRHHCWLLNFEKYVILHHGRFQPLFGIAANMWSTLSSDHIITINHNFCSMSTMEPFHCH